MIRDRAARTHLAPVRAVAIAAGVFALLFRPVVANAAPPVKPQQVSSDPFTNPTSQHQTEVEADDFSFGSSVVATFQAGRFFSGGGSSGIGFATSTDGGGTWSNGFLPSLTIFSSPPGPFGRATDPTVAYDSAHGQWLIATLACAAPPGTCFTATSITVSRSPDGLNWSAPVVLASGSQDHEWIACDNGSGNQHFGRCYVSWADIAGGVLATSSSDDGGQIWTPRASATGLFAPQSVVQPNGTLVVVGVTGGQTSFYNADSSNDGGATFTSAQISPVVGTHGSTGMRVTPAAGIEVDGGGKLYVTWSDCRFRAGCSANDAVLSASTDAISWSPLAPIPIDAVTSGVDHFIPGLGADRATSGSSAHVVLTYYYFPDAACTVRTCRLNMGFISSSDGGANWGTPIRLNKHPMRLSWLANTDLGHMVGDYTSTAFADGRAVTVFAVANRPSHTGVLHEYMVATAI
ncbi:MAG TPA: sialidase family protein [Actinomycetota bacterium]|nr:sialidase family protein [Actinomycetota bacterium]